MTSPVTTGVPGCVSSAEDACAQEAVVTRRRLLGGGAIGAAALMAPAVCRANAAASPIEMPGERPGDRASFYANFRGMMLQDQEGRSFDPTAFMGQTVLVNFVFTGCSTVCPVQTSALAEVQRRLPPAIRSQFRLLSVSLDPLGDTPQALKAYARRMGVDLSGWSFVTGRPDDIERVSDVLRLFRPGPDVRRPDDHATGLWLIDRSGQLRIRYDGNPPDVKRLLQEIPTLVKLTQRAGV